MHGHVCFDQIGIGQKEVEGRGIAMPVEPRARLQNRMGSEHMETHIYEGIFYCMERRQTRLGEWMGKAERREMDGVEPSRKQKDGGGVGLP